ncbi:MAG TPA: serine/threonine-protein kinase [Gemmatimonadales bacterium]|nr:serine/threonine-protein kinase [Gemmatimonadales bacterium]
MTSDQPAPGQRLGPYTLGPLLGQGGFAWVHSARRDDGNSFAVKVLKPRYATDPAFETRFRQEAAFAAGFEHPNIVHIEDVGAERGLAYFAMDLHPDSLSARLARQSVIPEGDAVAIGIGVTRALAYAHERNVIHRDIKPDNILLAADGRAVLTDFGIARAVSGYVAATGFMMTIGTPAYISPEQAQGRALDGRSDLYSLGITLYRMVTGDVPFKSNDWFELARMHVEDRPEPPRNRNPELSKRLERIILRLLAKHPADRQPSAAELLDNLADIAIQSRPTSDLPVPEGYLRDSKTVLHEQEQKKKGWWKVW